MEYKTSTNNSKTFKVNYRDRSFKVKAENHKDAVSKVINKLTGGK